MWGGAVCGGCGVWGVRCVGGAVCVGRPTQQLGTTGVQLGYNWGTPGAHRGHNGDLRPQPRGAGAGGGGELAVSPES